MKLIHYLELGCAQFNLDLKKGYIAKLPGQVLLPTVARIEGIGAPNGMLIFSKSNIVWPHRQLLEDEDFGFSVLSDPVRDEVFDSESFREMILDWGWKDTPQSKF